MDLRFLILCTAFFISGCSDPESYSQKIDRFESQIAAQEIKQAITAAEELSKQNIADVKLMTFRDIPIPVVYKQRYESMGFDTSTLNFYTPDWYKNQTSFNAEQKENREAEMRAKENYQPTPPKAEDFMGHSEHVH